METLVPRWEWRAFGQSFGAADARFQALTPGKVQESDEVYLLAPGCDANVKIRDGLMDIKQLQTVNADGLEQWRPILKGTFPLPAAEVERVCTALQVAPPMAKRPEYTLDQLQAELTDPARGVRAVQVRKKRTRYTVEGCSAEWTEVVADGHFVRTVAIELDDAARVIAAVREMGLEAFSNISYPRGLKQLLANSPRQD